jgi:HEAT repeat protein
MQKSSPMRRIVFQATCLLLLLSTTGSFAADLNTLIQDLGGNDESKRVTARQLLPREGMDAVPPLLALMRHENPVVWRTAKNVLADIGHLVSRPGYETERRSYTDQMMAVVLSDAPDWTVKHAIRLMGIVTPEGYPLVPLRETALDAKWREEMLGALEVMGTTESRRFLEALSRMGSVEDRVEVLELLRLVSGQVSPALLQDSDLRIRVAAMRALAQQGSPDLIAPFEQTLAGIDGDLRVEAVDAYLNLAEAVLEDGHDRKTGLDMYRHVLDSEKNARYRGAALAGLGRYGDASVVATILNSVKNKSNRDLEAPALMALGDLRSAAAYKTMLKAYPGVSDEMKLGLLGVFGRTQAPLFSKTLEAAANSTDEATREAAEQALRQFNLPSGINTAEASHPLKEFEVVE